MGLYEESRLVYNRILSEFPDLPDHSRDLLQEHIDQLDQEINERNGYDMEALLTDEEISFIRQEFQKTGESDGSHEQAVIFMETGQYAEAMEEFHRLLTGGTHLERFLGHLVELCPSAVRPGRGPGPYRGAGSEDFSGKARKGSAQVQTGRRVGKGPENRSRHRDVSIGPQDHP